MINIELGHYLALGGTIFLLGIVGIFLNRKNVIVILMSIELILLAVNINLVAFSTYTNEITGQIFTLFILTVAAAEAAIGLAIIVSYYRIKGSIRIEGSLEGDVVSQGEVFIGEKSCLKANVYGQRVVVAGEVTGNVEAVKGIKICSTGKVYGDISGDRLIVEEGGIYKGKVNMDVISSRNLYEGKFELVQSGA